MSARDVTERVDHAHERRRDGEHGRWRATEDVEPDREHEVEGPDELRDKLGDEGVLQIGRAHV